jgi:hypothetical protein
MTEHGYHKAQPDHCAFMKTYTDGDFIILLLYVNDMLIVGNGTKRELSKLLVMKDLGPA